MKAFFTLPLFFLLTLRVFAQPAAISPEQGARLARLMCRQLPNVATILSIVYVNDAQDPALQKPPQPLRVTDDVYDALLALGPSSVPCLVEKLNDPRFMPDPRSEPLLGSPVVGDVAYMILMDKGVEDLMPKLTHKNDLRMDDYFIWPSVGNHRVKLQAAVRAWLVEHPSCCGKPPVVSNHDSETPKFKMSSSELAKARSQFALLRPGMSPAQVLKIAGEPNAIDEDIKGKNGHSQQLTAGPNLLGMCARDHNEHLAYIYFIEQWTDHAATRNPLRDRYVILFFSATGKFTRMFSNVEEIAPIFPSNVELWFHLMWGAPLKTHSTVRSKSIQP